MRVGVVGAGYISRIHIPAILRAGGNRIVGIVDTDAKKVEEIASRFGVRGIYTDFDLMLEEEAPEVVHILTPPQTHAGLAISAIESGAHVLIEKPMACSHEDTEKILAAAIRNSVSLCVNHNLLFDPLTVKARELVKSGKIGRLVHIDIHYIFDLQKNLEPYIYNDAYMHWAYNLPGGPLQDLAPHPVSLLLCFLNEPKRIWSISKNNGVMPMGWPDELKVLVDGDDVTGFLSMSFGAKPDDLISIDIYGTEMTINVNLSNMTLFTQKASHIPKKISKGLTNLGQGIRLISSTFVSSFKFLRGGIPPVKGAGQLITSFYETLRNNEEPPVTGKDGRNVVEFISQIWGESTRTIRPHIG